MGISWGSRLQWLFVYQMRADTVLQSGDRVYAEAGGETAEKLSRERLGGSLMRQFSLVL
jgi:hypothetical protein